MVEFIRQRLKQFEWLFEREVLSLICINDKEQTAVAALLRSKSISQQHRKEANLVRRFERASEYRLLERDERKVKVEVEVKEVK